LVSCFRTVPFNALGTGAWLRAFSKAWEAVGSQESVLVTLGELFLENNLNIFLTVIEWHKR